MFTNPNPAAAIVFRLGWYHLPPFLEAIKLTVTPTGGSNASVLLVFADPVMFPVAQPYGLMILKAALEQQQIDVEVVCPFTAAQPYEYLAELAARKHPAVIGFSFRNLDTAGFSYSSNGEQTFLPELRQLVAAARPYTDCIAIGGSGFSIAPLQILDDCGADIGFVGTSENDFAIFCARRIFEGFGVAAAMAGLTSAVLRDAPAAPIPQRVSATSARQFNPAMIEYARLVGGTVPVRTKTGCTLRCTYCVVPWIEQLNLRPWPEIEAELQLILENDLANRVFIADGEFNLPDPAYAVDLCNKIYARFGSEIKWRCYLEAGFITEELVKTMIRAGCVGISLTVDSLSSDPRRRFAKGTPTKSAVEGIRLCLESTAHVAINLLFGGPGETMASAEETASLAKGFNQQGADLAISVGLRVYPNTPFEKLVRLSRFAKHFHPLNGVNWLGAFCSPVPAATLGEYVNELLPPSPSVQYTNSIEESSLEFYRQMAQTAASITNKDWERSAQQLSATKALGPNRKEILLAQWKITHRLSGSPPA